LNDGSVEPYGYGLISGNHRGLATILHNGGLDGFQSHLIRYPDAQLTIVVLMNALPSGHLPAPGEVADRIAAQLLWQQMEPRKLRTIDPAADPETFADFAGIYDYDSSARMVVAMEDNQLYAQLTGQERYPIFPVGDDRFVWRIVEAEIQFVKDDQGKVIKGIHTQNGRSFDVPRLPDVKRIELSEEQLDEFVGRYNYGLFAGKMTVTREGKRLMAQLRGQPKLEIVPVGEDEFRWVDVTASIQFERDEDGQIVRGQHTQNGRTFAVPRVE
jgi:hypothetical protein